MIRYRGVPKFLWLSYNVGIQIHTPANTYRCEWVTGKTIDETL